MKLVLLAIGVLGLACATFLFPFLAAAVARLRKRKEKAGGKTAIRSIDVLVAAHNEEGPLSATLASIFSAIASLADGPDRCDVRVLVGADACRDRTAEVATRFGARVIRCFHESKWLTLRRLVAEAPRADWCVLADAGVVWPRKFLASVLGVFREEGCVGVAPAYYPESSGLWERLHWGIERRLKNLEAGAGGPISTHGATVAYRREELVRALGALGDRCWLNDDVVLPWTIRLQNPGSSIRYWLGSGPEERLVDRGLRRGSPEYGRRRRMVIGNLQWLGLFGWEAFRRNPPAALLGLRRASRIFWAYWVLCLAVALLPLPWLAAACALGGLAALGIVRPACGVAQSALASLLAPVYLLREVRGGRRGVAWS